MKTLDSSAVVERVAFTHKVLEIVVMPEELHEFFKDFERDYRTISAVDCARKIGELARIKEMLVRCCIADTTVLLIIDGLNALCVLVLYTITEMGTSMERMRVLDKIEAMGARYGMTVRV